MGNMELLCIQCRGIGTHLAASGKSHDFFSSCGGNLGYIPELPRDDPSKPLFVQRRQDSCLLTRDTSGISSRLGRALRTLLEVRRETQGIFLVTTVILGFLSIFKKVRHPHRLKHELRVPVDVSKGCEASCPDEAVTEGFALGLPRGFRHGFIF